ncbi:protein kinase [Actinomadura sp. 6N118]|uniref:protein kinase domain-containing protein n=1 Tax=Actinomadura sp. 6N118 TaxID=3375151 RepID=UPI00379E3E44
MKIGELLAGRYRLTGELGRGGMGTVWRARDETLNREVAVKELVLPRESSQARRELAVRRALREARAAARLRNPSIITVHDVVLADGRPWIVMELLSGRSLDKVIELDGPIEPHRVAALGLEILDALHTAHGHGIEHRDVKPANVFLRDDGHAILTDFGIAALAGDTPLTRPGALIGSPAYMPPERIRGEPGGPPSDLWSLGATLYTLVEGRTPFGGSTPMGVLGAVLADEPTAPQRAGPLAGLLLRLLTKDASARPTATQTRRELAAISQASATATTESTESTEATGPADNAETLPPDTGASGGTRRRPVTITLAVLVCLVTTVTGFALLRDGRSSGRADRPAPFATVPSLCGLLSPAWMNRLVPMAGVGSDTTATPEDYFNHYIHPKTDTCLWNERNATHDGHSAVILSRPVEASPPDDPMRRAHADFTTMRQAVATSAAQPRASPTRTAPRPVPGVGDEAFVWDETTGEAEFQDWDAVVIFRTRNLVTRVEYKWYKKDYGKGYARGIPPPGGIEPLRQGAIQISRWLAPALLAGRPLAAAPAPPYTAAISGM